MAKSKGWAFIGSIPIIGFILVLLARRDDAYAMFYAKEGLVLGILAAIANAVFGVIRLHMFMGVVDLVAFILWLVIAVNAFSGVKKSTPLIGEISKKLKL